MCPTLTGGNFFRRVRSTFLFICSTTSNVKNFEPRQLEPQKRIQNEKKKQNRRPEPQNHTKDPPIALLFFGTVRLFLKLFGLNQRVPPSFVSTFCNTMDVKNPQRVRLWPFSACFLVRSWSNVNLKCFHLVYKKPKDAPMGLYEFH